ncbi:hypothetical protein [Streptomyces sp. AD55]|uniref:hypothetical protein n=1 Tax=Streptomyces sp. AD55 TaxID=3242895 RepID=UPI0035271D48
MTTLAPARPEADYNHLTAEDQDRFDALMEQADNAGPHDYPVYMTALTALTGVTGEVRKCACSCWCPALFDANAPGVGVIEYGEGFNLGRHQCSWCADQHPETA